MPQTQVASERSISQHAQVTLHRKRTGKSRGGPDRRALIVAISSKARQMRWLPTPMLWTVVPAIVFCSIGMVSSRPSLSNSSKRTSAEGSMRRL